MSHYVRQFTIFLLCCVTLTVLVSQVAFRDPKTKATGKLDIKSPPVTPDSIDFAGERVPMERWEVRERMEREVLFNFYNTPNILHTMKLASRHFPLISERLKANGIPDDFKYLCVAESNLEVTARSRVGATSFWQFMDNTGPGYNLTINPQVDQRYDLERATDAACRYLKDAYNLLGNWTAAAASYNCGMGGYSRQAAFQKSKNFYDLYLPEETNRYIFRILTFKHLLSNAESLGFTLNESDKYKPVPFTTQEVRTSIPDLSVFALQNGTNYKMLKILNPWIRGKSLTIAPGKSMTLKLPGK